ncbi:unnamed protein product [Paramecium primaurelia]|uniref:Insulin-like growth factor binding protein, N-terminal n=1 Tax=Paramecium primaurelia TaxID=5886 RepID=A0A8S1P5M5_PARPR|nr:unnamed protein product [Paramecium primaurelia]
MISKFKQFLLLILILNQSQASFQSYYWISSQTQNLNSIQWDTICSCCSFQYELCGLESILVINQCSLNDYNQIVFKTLRLQPHYQITLTFIFWRIDEWNDYDFDVYLDYQRVHSNQYSHITSNQNICRNSLYNDELFPISITIPHTMSSITVMLVVERGIWGISQMILEAKLCPVDCESCIENQCLDQFLHFSTLVQQLVVNSSEGWLTNNQIQITTQTFLQAKFLQPNANHLINEIELIPHQAISIQIKVLVYNSNPTEINIEIDDVLVSRTYYTEGWIKYKNGYGYRSQKSISIYQYPHINDKAKISLQLNIQEPTFSLYFAIRDFQLFLKSSLFEYTCNDDNFLPYDGCFQKNFDCIEGCSNCVRGLCLDCKLGWEYFEKEQLCIPICGDLIITSYEECDDGNNILYDGCYQCKHSCPQNCRICEFGKCLECNVNYKLSSNKKQCNSICFNDIKILNGIFQYQSSREWDSNQLCQQSCQLECKLCIDNNCYQCIDGWKLENNECNKFCGDGQVAINSIELCDDGNYNDNDGCYQCQFECIPYCYFCSNQNTCLFCQQYFILQDNQCLPYCGDGIIIEDLEECEDLNNKPYDGCYQCKYSCIQNCEICQLGICLQCNKGYIIYDNFCMNLKENQEEIENQDENQQIQSLNYCGDGIIQKYESCDDFNSLNFDGQNIFNQAVAILKHILLYPI